MFKKLTLSMQISGGYALVLLLLIVISLAAYFGRAFKILCQANF